MAGVRSYICKNPEMSQELEKMFNKQRYSDTTFLVNQQKFHASSHLVSKSSEFLETLMGNHFENCGDREIKMGEIKSEYSFSVILQYMYGLEIDFSQVNKAVLCEVLGLAEKYELTNLFKEVKTYFLMLDHFDIDTVVPLVTIAKKYHLEGFYKTLEMFIYQNAEHVVKHQTFNDLPYDIVLQLVKSDFFFVDEIEVLKGVIMWHDSNIINSLPNDQIELDETNDVSSVPIKEDEEIENKNEKETCKDLAAENSSSNIDVCTKSVGDKSSDGVLKTFSNNVLKTLLSQIRFPFISTVDMYELSQTEIYAKYKEFLVNLKYSQSSKKQRTSILSHELVKLDALDIIKEFTVRWFQYEELYESNEEETVDDLKWKICMIAKKKPKHENLIMKLKCTSVNHLEGRECTISFRIKLISDVIEAPNFIIPGDNAHTTVVVNSENPCQDIANFYIQHDFLSAYDHETNGDYYTRTYKFELSLLSMSIHSKVKV